MSSKTDKEIVKEISRKKKNNLLKIVKRPFVKLYKLFRTINKDTKMIIGVWFLVLVILSMIALFVANTNASRQKYYDMEKAMNAGTLSYVESAGIYPTIEGKERIPLEALLLSGDVYESDVADSSCTGFSMVYYDDENSKYIIESYISCDEYTTKDYTDNLDYGNN